MYLSIIYIIHGAGAGQRVAGGGEFSLVGARRSEYSLFAQFGTDRNNNNTTTVVTNITRCRHRQYRFTQAARNTFGTTETSQYDPE